MPPTLVLASTSPYRRRLLERLGVPFEVAAPDVDERALSADGTPPGELAERLARAKARAVAWSRQGAAVLGSDQVCSCDGRILHKPGTADGAVAQLSRLQGRSHQLCTAVAIVHAGRETAWIDRTTLVMRPLTDAQIRRYVARDEPLDCAGSYKLEEAGIALFDRIETQDHTAITGLPLLRLTRELVALGFDVPG